MPPAPRLSEHLHFAWLARPRAHRDDARATSMAALKELPVVCHQENPLWFQWGRDSVPTVRKAGFPLLQFGVLALPHSPWRLPSLLLRAITAVHCRVLRVCVVERGLGLSQTIRLSVLRRRVEFEVR